MINQSDNRKAFYGFQIPHEWRLEKLGIFGETYTGLSGKTKDDFGIGKPYIPYLNIFNNAIIRDGAFDYVNIEIEENQYLVQNGDLFFTTSSETPEEVGMCSVYLGNEPELYLNSFCFGFRTYDKAEISTEYLAQLFRSSLGRRIIYKLAQGATRYNISKTNLLNEEIPLPPLSEQKAIAQVLSTADAAILTTEKLIAQKELRKKWLMQQLLTGKKRLKGFENTKWRIQPLENFIKPIVREVPKPDVPYLGIGLRSHGKGTFLKHDEQPEKNSMDKFYVVRPNDLIVNITFAWEQAIAIVRPEDDGALASHRFPTYTFIEEKGHPDFFRFFIIQPRMKFMLEMISPGGAGRNRVMSKSDFIKLEFLLPEYKEQTAIAQVLQAADKEISLLKAKAEKLREQKKGLMQVLLTGKVRLKINE
ncbi:MAG TPA: restriction endonuclease subunit S [Edaphocola sp.]|nr:restriction endonuclease subunit S [Edaphocola sp.]